ncbi:MAG: PfkB family carbohydrate kinase [Sphaerochaetaceae bacterium]|nr:PfkB family carbohydrate kinase [Sphaerochaetaceae bacterium]NLY07459.1 hypothetical protein [Spirochaetales bacterium]
MIVTLGESLVDVIGDKAYVGGSPLNVAMAASRLDSSVAYVGRISSDEYGKQILDRLIEDLVFFEPRLCNTEKPTSSSKAIVQASGDVSYSFSFDGTAAMSTTSDDILLGFESIADLEYVFTGSVALACEPCGSAIEDVISGLDDDVVVFIDPNVRVSAAKDMEKLKQRLERMFRRADVVRFSSDDIEALYGDVEDGWVAERMANLGVGNLIITRGRHGSSWYCGDLVLNEPAMEVDVVDTIGCGDTFDGSILHCLDRLGYHENRQLGENEIRKILKFAALAATENCRRKGCNPPRLGDCRELDEIESSL